MEEFIKSVCVEDLNNAQNTMFTIFRTLDTAAVGSLVPKAEMIHNTFLLNKSYEFIAQNLSLLAVLKYKIDKNNYKIAINMLEDARFLAENSHNKNAIKTNLFCWGYIYNAEKNYSMALNVLKQARNINSSNEAAILIDTINSLAKCSFCIGVNLSNASISSSNLFFASIYLSSNSIPIVGLNPFIFICPFHFFNREHHSNQNTGLI